MRNELIELKQKILKRISIAEYRKLLVFVEEVYLSKYGLKILLARKCANLFFALLELVREEDGGRVRQLYEQTFQKENEPIIISDRALCYYEQAIKEGKFENILIVDDVIIHARTIVELYEKLEGLLQDTTTDIAVQAYVANQKEELLNKACVQNAKVGRQLDLSGLRQISDFVVDIFKVCSQPYTSYVPNGYLDLQSPTWLCMLEFLQRQGTNGLYDADVQELKVQSYAWIDAQKWKFALFQSMRFYVSEDIGRCAIVPMVSLMPVEETVLREYGEVLKKLFCKAYYDKMFLCCKELSYRAIIYVVSALWGRYFVKKYLPCEDVESYCEDVREEWTNFGAQILNQEELNRLSVEELESFLKQLDEKYKSVDEQLLLNLDQDFTELDSELTKIIDSGKFENSVELTSRFLFANGELDEKNWREKREKSKRLAGYPLFALANKSREICSGEEVYGHILKAIDSGKGSIVAKVYEHNGRYYYISLIHSGERNYKYIVQKYFPYLYGLFDVEQMAYEKSKSALGYKKRFLEAFQSEIQTNKFGNAEDFYEDDLEKLCKVNVTQNYASVLIRDAYEYMNRNDSNMDAVIALADKVII